MKLKPIGDLILVKEQEKSDKTVSGIIIPDSVENDYIYADVISTGPGLFTQTGNRIPMTVKPGDTVVLHKNQSGSNKKIKLEKEEYLLLHESEIVMVSV
jgi:chaperonin GroES|tara:strand:- start:232 stop:528 length:297 start_codon:yes stop_codon:yes gene_type:complete